MGRSTRILAAAVSAAVVLACGQKQERPDLSQHNLLLITVDTLRADRLGAYGHEAAVTPNLDRLAAGGVRFENVYTAVPLTLPAHTTLFTGRYPFATGVRQNAVNFVGEDEVTLAELFREKGFTTSAIIAAYVLTSTFGLDQGFDTYDDSLQMDDLYRFFSSITADEVYERFSRWLHANESERFFSWVHLYDPHHPYTPPEPYAGRFSEDPYDGEIAFVDAQIGRILQDLEKLGLLDRTLIAVTSDHGEAFREHVEEGHGMLCYDETMRVPLILHAPNALPADRVVRERVALVDIVPTMIDLFDLERPTRLQGRSLVEFLLGQEDPEPRGIYIESLAGVKEKGWAPRTGLVSEDFKLIKVPEPELYDLAADPGETENLFEQRGDIVGRLDRELRELLLGTEGEDKAAERELTEEDRRHLEALGYLDSTQSRAADLIEPKVGIEVDMRIREIRGDLERGGSLDEAAADLERLIRAHPDLDTSDFYELRYQIAQGRGDRDAAIAALEEGMQKFPDSNLAFTLANYRRQIGDLEEAERLGLELQRSRPRFPQVTNLLGLIAEDRGDLEGALQHFEQALELESDNIPLRLKIADTGARLGDLDTAIEIYEDLFQIGALDDQAEGHFKAATLNLMVGDLARAEELFQEGLTLEPAGRHYLSLAMVQARAGKIDTAVATIETALQDFSDSMSPQEIALASATLQQLRGQL